MTTPQHGYVPAEYLAPLPAQKGHPVAQAELNTATAVARLHADHPTIYVNGPAGGYWSHALSVDIHNNPAKYGVTDKALSPVGASPHELGTRINIEGVAPDTAAKYGFIEYNSYTYDYAGVLSWNEAPKFAANQRRVVAAGAHVRSAPSDTASIVETLAGGSIITALDYRSGIVKGKTATWLHISRGFVWVGGVTLASLTGIPEYVAPVVTGPFVTGSTTTPTARPVEVTPVVAPVTAPTTPVVSTPETPSVPAAPTTPEVPTVTTTPTPVIDPDLSAATLGPAVANVTTLVSRFIPTKVRAVVYTTGLLVAGVAVAIAPVFGGEVNTVLDAASKALLAMTGVLALSNISK